MIKTEWIEKAKEKIAFNNETIEEAAHVSSCDRDYWNDMQRAAIQAKTENVFLLEGIKLMSE